MYRISRVYKDLCCLDQYRFTVQRGQRNKMPRLDERNWTAFPPAIRVALIRGWCTSRHVRPVSEFIDGAIIFDVPEWREDFLGYCRDRRRMNGDFDWGFEEEAPAGAATPVRECPPTQPR